ncbi:MAG: HNH endonuclease [Bacteroidetes bacterium]|nr:HNH endonuclease [Bacteroidota bacterium]MCA6442543.1 HNH endonuclease [Bacteroidota bacterium]
MFGCFNFIKEPGKALQIFFKKISIKTDFSVLVDVIIYYSKGYDKYLNDLFSAVDPKTTTFLESGEIYLSFYMFRKEDINNLGACIDMIDNTTQSMLLRIRSAEELDIFTHFYKLSDSGKLTELAKIIKYQLKANTDFIFDPAKAKKAIKRVLKIDIDIPQGPNGLGPDYSSVKDIIVNGNSVIYNFNGSSAMTKIKYSSVRDVDFRIAFEKLGMSSDDIKKIEDLYVWHHLDDWDPVSGEGTMQLVLKSLHNSTGYGDALNHTGGVAMWKWFYLIDYR